MMFSELYGTYYQAVASILTAALDHPLREDELRRLIEKSAFEESILTIEPALREGRWPLLRPDGTAMVTSVPTLPLTTLQRRWLKAISLDPRVRLFTDTLPDYGDVPPLFTSEDIYVFDRYADGDPYTDEGYIARFRCILAAIRERRPLRVLTENRRGDPLRLTVVPELLEYSEKDDKFRLICSGSRFCSVINLGRIQQCEALPPSAPTKDSRSIRARQKQVVLELTDRRNALERVMLHFAHFEKEAERLDGTHYRLTLTYDANDETELVIRVLSFGPMLKAIAPRRFVEQIKTRLKQQMQYPL